jgi:hypothetical protein
MLWLNLGRWKARLEVNMIDEKAKIQMSLLPLILLAVLVLGGLYLLNKGDVKVPFLKDDSKEELRRLQNFPTAVPNSTEIKQQRILIVNQEELDEFLNLVDPSGLLSLAEDIDFEAEYLIAATTDTLYEGENDLKIKKVYKDKENDSLLALIEHKKPGDSCDPEVWQNVAVDIVAISKTEKEVSFDKQFKVFECD